MEALATGCCVLLIVLLPVVVAVDSVCWADVATVILFLTATFGGLGV